MIYSANNPIPELSFEQRLKEAKKERDMLIKWRDEAYEIWLNEITSESSDAEYIKQLEEDLFNLRRDIQQADDGIRQLEKEQQIRIQPFETQHSLSCDLSSNVADVSWTAIQAVIIICLVSAGLHAALP